MRSPPGSSTVTVPLTWVAEALSPRTVTSIRSPSTPATEPVSIIVSPG